MEYEYELTITAGTAKASPVKTTCQLARGIIHQFSVTFLEGCNGLVSVAIFDGGFQCFPLNPGGAIKGNAETVTRPTFYPLESGVYKLIAKGWAPDCTYNHTVLLRFDVLPREYFENISQIQEVIKAVSTELQAAQAAASEVLAEKLASVAELVTPRLVEEEETVPDPAEELELERANLLALLSPLDRATLLAQIRQGWTDDRIIAANKSNQRLFPDRLAAILAALRAEIGVFNG